MFSKFKSFFFGVTDTTLPTLNLTTKDTTMKATIQPVGEKFGLFTGGQLVGTYARERDAKRGAARRELTVIAA